MLRSSFYSFLCAKNGLRAWGPFLTSPLTPRGEICPLGGMFTPSFTPRVEYSRVFRRMNGRTENFTPRGHSRPWGWSVPLEAKLRMGLWGEWRLTLFAQVSLNSGFSVDRGNFDRLAVAAQQPRRGRRSVVRRGHAAVAPLVASEQREGNLWFGACSCRGRVRGRVEVGAKMGRKTKKWKWNKRKVLIKWDKTIRNAT
jgi:hypothetical protein